MSKNAMATRVGALLAAIGVSACCWLPLLLVGLGAGATGIGAFFDPLRPYLMATTLLLLGAAFFFTYRRRTVCAADSSCSPSGSSGRSRRMLWGITLVAAVSFVFPYWSAARLANANASESELGSPAFEIPVEGLTCAACAVSLHEKLMSVQGVAAAKVDESTDLVRIWGKADPEAVATAIRRAGFAPGAPRKVVHAAAAG